MVIGLSILLAGCATVPTANGPAKVWFPMEARFDGEGHLTSISPNDNASKLAVDALDKVSDKALDRVQRFVDKANQQK